MVLGSRKKTPRRSEDLETTAGREGANSVQMKVAAEHDLANYYSECTGLNLWSEVDSKGPPAFIFFFYSILSIIHRDLVENEKYSAFSLRVIAELLREFSSVLKSDWLRDKHIWSRSRRAVSSNAANLAESTWRQ